ncbi:uncharacterized protein KZ484_010950 [Pholidichthys leucotaenia]
MFDRLVEQRWAVVAVLSDRNVTKLQDARMLELKDEYWQLMEDTQPVLSALKCATTVMSAEEDVSISNIYPVTFGLVNIHLIRREEDGARLVEFKEKVRSSLIERMNVQSDEFVSSVSMIATMLDPRHKHLGFLSPAQRVVANAKLVHLATAVGTSEEEAVPLDGDEVTSDRANTAAADSKRHVSAMALLLGDDYATHHETDIDAEFQNFLRETPPPLDFPQKHDCKEEEVLADQQLWNQERNSVLDQEKPEPPQLKKEHEEPDPPQVKEEQEELCISQEGEQLVVKLEADTIMVTLISEEKQQSEAEPKSEQLLSHNSAGTEIQDEERSRHVDSGLTKEEEPKPKKRRLKTGRHSNSDDDSLTSKTLYAPQLHDCKEEEVLTVQQLWNQERNSSLDQEEQDAAQVKVEEEELCSSQEEEDFGLKHETDTFMVTPTDENNDKSETEPKNFPQKHDCKEEEVLADQQLWNQERNSVLDQEKPEPPQLKKEHEEPDPPQVKEEQEELCISQEGEQLVVKLEADTIMVTLISEEKQQSEAEPKSEQLLSHNSAGTEIQDEERSRHVDSGLTKEEEPKPKKRRLKTGRHSNSDDDSLTSKTLYAPQLHDCKEEEVLTVQQLWNQERNSSLDQEEQDAAQVKVEEEELCSSQEEEDFGLKHETDTFMVTPTDENNDKSETEPKSEQLLSHNSPDTESQDQEAGKNVNPGSSKHEEPKLKKRLHRNRSDRNNVDNSSMSENQCDTDTGEKSVKCSDNDKDCKNESQNKKHDIVKLHLCNTCGKRLKNKRNLSVHERIHTGEKPFSCETCGQSFNERGTLKSHMRIHTGEKPFSCETCGQSFNRRDTLKTHMTIHTGEKPFSCQTCGQSFNRRSHLKTHMRIHTGEKPFSCETCGQSFTGCGDLNAHTRIHTGEKPFSCETCGQSFNRSSDLKTHMRIHTGEKPFSCETCGQSFNRRSSLKTHVRIHTGEKPFSCETCGQRFNERGALKRHMRIHTGEKPFSCETCGQRFTRCGDLKIHTRIHTGEKPFSCETCGQSFNRRSDLKTHTRIHTGEKPFSCETCGQRFNERGTLKCHMRIHTGEKPFSCETCGQRFSCRSSLKIHVRIHTGEKPFFCESCGQNFTQYGSLISHMRIHTGEKPVNKTQQPK